MIEISFFVLYSSHFIGVCYVYVDNHGDIQLTLKLKWSAGEDQH